MEKKIHPLLFGGSPIYIYMYTYRAFHAPIVFYCMLHYSIFCATYIYIEMMMKTNPIAVILRWRRYVLSLTTNIQPPSFSLSIPSLITCASKTYKSTVCALQTTSHSFTIRHWDVWHVFVAISWITVFRSLSFSFDECQAFDYANQNWNVNIEKFQLDFLIEHLDFVLKNVHLHKLLYLDVFLTKKLECASCWNWYTCYNWLNNWTFLWLIFSVGCNFYGCNKNDSENLIK